MKLLNRFVCLLLSIVTVVSLAAVPASAAGNLVSGIGFVSATSLRLRKEPNTTSQVLDTAFGKECVVVESKEGSWYKVIYNLQEGYMHEDFLKVLPRENAELGWGKVTGSSVNLRAGAGTGHPVTGRANLGDKVYIIGLNDGWYKVIFGERISYIRSDFVELTELPYENRKSPNTPKFFRGGKSTGIAPSAAALSGKTPGTSTANGNPNTADPSVTGNAILAEAQKHLGAPYVWGGASPAGFDCSGFVYYVLKTLGFKAYRTPEDQYRMGTPVQKADLQPGDIVYFFGTYANQISHVGIYAGNGSFIHAPNSRSTVSYSNLTHGYWSDHYFGARRMSK